MGKKKTGWALSCRKLNGVAVKDLRIDGISSHSVSVSVLARKHSAYSESDRRPGGIAEAPEFEGASNSSNADRFVAIFGHFRRFFVKMAHKTTSVSGYPSRFEFLVVDFIENDVHIDIVSWRIFEIRGAKVLLWAVFTVFRQNDG